MMEKEKNVETEEPKKKDRVCPCCSDTVCIGIAWGIFAIILIIFIILNLFRIYHVYTLYTADRLTRN